jgi:hypothetical protein
MTITDPGSSIVVAESTVLKYLKHFAILAALGAVSVILVALLQMAGSFNVSSLPIVWQGFAYLVLPIIVAAGMKVKAEIDAELAAQEAANMIAKLQLANKELDAKNLTLERKRYRGEM